MWCVHNPRAHASRPSPPDWIRFNAINLTQLFYSNNAAREAFVELCESEYVQKVTFDSYLYKKVRGLECLRVDGFSFSGSDAFIFHRCNVNFV